jgi:alanine racemase
MSANSYTKILINLDNLSNNLEIIKNKIGKNVKLMAIVKDNAYGHGISFVSKFMPSKKIDYFGVSSICEANNLIRLGIKAPILVMGIFDENEIYDLAQNINLTIYDKDSLKILTHKAIKKNIPVHLKLDIGMHRLGFYENEAKNALEKIKSTKFLKLNGIYSHLPDYNTPCACEEIEKFQKFILSLKTRPITHLASSGPTFFHNNSHFDMVRCGISLYGYLPKNDEKNNFGLKPVMEITSNIASIKTVHKGDTISYNRNYKVSRDSIIGVVPMGYADGYFKLYSKFGYVLVNGRRVPIVGDICMDMFMIDITELKNAHIGTQVTLLGENQNEKISAYDLAKSSGFIPYEILTGAGVNLRKEILCK